MYGVEKISRKLSWLEVTEAIQTEIQSILGTFFKCEAVLDDSSYWDIRFEKNGITIEQLCRLLKAVGADGEMTVDTIQSLENNTIATNSAGMSLSIELLKRHLRCNWDCQLICQDALWLVGIREQDEKIWEPAVEINGRMLHLSGLKSQTELMEYLLKNGATHSNLMDFCEEYREQYQNELCWPYPISDGKHLGTFLILVKEGVLSLPYDDADKEEYELFCTEDARLFRTAEEMEVFIQDWHSFDNDLRQAMSAMKRYLEKQEASHER